MKLKSIDNTFPYVEFPSHEYFCKIYIFESRVKIHYNSLLLNCRIEETNTKKYVMDYF